MKEDSDIMIPENAEIVFVSDLFIEDYAGGAEMTTEAIIQASPFSVFKLHTKDVNMKTLEAGVGKFWIFGNYASLDLNLIPTIVSNIRYSILEYDYKYCKYRSPEKHKASENIECNCHQEPRGKMISAFMHGSRSLWWMSEKQRDLYFNMFPFLRERSNIVLSSVFDDNFFAKVALLREQNKENRDEKFVIIGSNSWIKGVEDSIAFCEKNSLEYEVIWNKTYSEVLEKLSVSKGMVFLPRGGDTCPRTVIEAKLLGCSLILNENVQHKDELWFSNSKMIDTESYLYAARNRFWNGIKENMSYFPTISGYTTTLNCFRQDYPFEECINSLLGFCDQVVIVDGGSEDGTWEKILEISRDDDRIVAHQEVRDWTNKRFAVYDGLQKALARSLCTMDYCWQQDSDEIVHEEDYGKVKTLTRSIPTHIEVLCLPVIEYWGGDEKVRIDVNPWKWRLSKNLPHITHGIPSQLRKFDSNGDLYALPGTDGCDYIRNDSYDVIGSATFYTNEVDAVRNECMKGDKKYIEDYQAWLRLISDAYPTVYHYSWFNISRKIRTYKNYWSKHWQSLYDIKQKDTSENNMFFNKPWSEVTEEEMDTMSRKLSLEMGGWVFHSKVDFDKKTPYITIDRNHPAVMNDWIKRNTLSEKK